MSSSIYYKFKSQLKPSRATFDGTGLSLWDLKRQILLDNKMGKGGPGGSGWDFDLSVVDASTEEEYRDDNFILPRSTSVLVRRLPPKKAGLGSASRYVQDLAAPAAGSTSSSAGPAGKSGAVTDAGTGRSEHLVSAADQARDEERRKAMARQFDTKVGGGGLEERDRLRQLRMGITPLGQESSAPTLPGKTATNPNDRKTVLARKLEDSAQTAEDARIAAMLAQSSAQWDETQDRLEQFKPIHGPGGARSRPPGKPSMAQLISVPDRPPPDGYICYRCGKKGHWIQACPTLGNMDYDHKRMKRSTGIPREFLREIQEGEEVDEGSIMVTPDGKQVVMRADDDGWNKARGRGTGMITNEIFQSAPKDPSLACPLCGNLLRQAVRSTCCHAVFCEECLRNAIEEGRRLCPTCGSEDVDEGEPDEEIRAKVRTYVQSTIREIRTQEADRRNLESSSHGQREESQALSATMSRGVSQDPGNNPTQAEGDIATQNGTSDQYQANSMMMMPGMVPMPMLQQQAAHLTSRLSDPSLDAQTKVQTQFQLSNVQMQIRQMQFMFMQQMQNQFSQGGASGSSNLNTDRQGYRTSFTHQQKPSEDSPYQRPPVNERNRARRDRVERQRLQQAAVYGGGAAGNGNFAIQAFDSGAGTGRSHAAYYNNGNGNGNGYGSGGGSGSELQQQAAMYNAWMQSFLPANPNQNVVNASMGGHNKRAHPDS